MHWRRDRLPTPVFLVFPCGSAGKKSACNVGDLGSVPGLGRYPEEGKGYPLQYFDLENSIDYIVHEVAESDTTEPLLLSDIAKFFCLKNFLKWILHKYVQYQNETEIKEWLIIVIQKKSKSQLEYNAKETSGERMQRTYKRTGSN